MQRSMSDTNIKFLECIKKSFQAFLISGAGSNKKLKILHPCIANIIKTKLGNDYTIKSLNENTGKDAGKEETIAGRYYDKIVDITIMKDNKHLAGIAVKFVMNNYKQNSNNYFENMLGETANIRTNKIKYFQVFIVPNKMPYFNNDKRITKWEKITKNNLNKYINLADDNTDIFYHTPNKTLIFIVEFPVLDTEQITNKEQYKNFYLGNDTDFKIVDTDINFGDGVVLNDIDKFANKISHLIKSI